MKLYVTHSSEYDYKTELYQPLKAVFSNEYEIIYPHDIHEYGVNSSDILATCDAILAEVTLPSTGQGIELGWANYQNIPIICFYRANSNPSSALRFISKSMVEYKTTDEMVAKLRSEIKKFA